MDTTPDRRTKYDATMIQELQHGLDLQELKKHKKEEIDPMKDPGPDTRRNTVLKKYFEQQIRERDSLFGITLNAILTHIRHHADSKYGPRSVKRWLKIWYPQLTFNKGQIVLAPPETRTTHCSNCPRGKKRRLNLECSYQLCRHCCVQSPGICRLISHRKSGKKMRLY